MNILYKNRHGDFFIFELLDDGNILWTGDFKYVRIGMPNDYTRAYNQYVNDNKGQQGLMSFNQFKSVIHDYDEKTNKFVHDKYLKLVDVIENKINMVDPSGGPYIEVGMSMERINEAFKNLNVKSITNITNNGYLINTYTNHE